MPEALSSIVEDNAEEIFKQFFEADEATVIVEEECEDPKAFMLEVKYEGELENTDEVFFANTEESEKVQYVKVLNVIDDCTALASYTFEDRQDLHLVANAIENQEA